MIKECYRLGIVCLILSGFLLGCYTAVETSSQNGFIYKSEATEYIEAISKNTILFGTGVRMTGNSDVFFTGIGKPGAASSVYPGFPLLISATMMTDEVLRSAGEFYQNTLGMNMLESDSLLIRYNTDYDLKNNNLIWIYMRTTFAKEYLSPDRWVIFVEDEDENQYEPKKVPLIVTLSPENEPPVRQNWRRAQTKKVQFGLLLPKSKFDGTPWVPENGNLKIVFMNPNKGIERADGSWVFSKE